MASDAQKSFHGIAARLDRMPISGFHMKIMWLLAGITFCDSVDMSIGGPIGAVLQDEGFMTLEQFAFFNSITMVGYLIGGLLSGLVSDGFGRKKAVIACGTIFTAACFVAAMAPNADFLTACRFVMGIGLGAAFPAGYSALTEYTPPHKRGKYQSYMGLIANCGTLFGSVMNLIILPMAGWREVFVFCGVLGAVVMLIIGSCMNESPRWLASSMATTTRQMLLFLSLKQRLLQVVRKFQLFQLKKLNVANRNRKSSSCHSRSCSRRR